MPNFRRFSMPFRHGYDGVPPKPVSMDDNLTRPTSGNLVALRKTEMANDLRKQVGRNNVHTFSGVRSGISSGGPRLVAQRIVDPYVNHLKNSGQLADQQVVDILTGMVSQLGRPALAQQVGNPQQYVSHGFDHSERVAAYTNMIVRAHPEIEESAARKYNISPALARLLFQIVAHWHDVGYSDLDGRPKPTHGLSSASKFDDNLFAQLTRLVLRENGHADQVLSDMRKAIQLHSADVKVESYPIKVTTDRGSLLIPDADALGKLLDHYSLSSRHSHRISQIEICGSNAREVGSQVNAILKARSSRQFPAITIHEKKPEYTGRPTSLDKGKQVKVGLRYTDQELTQNPFAVIRLADNLDMAADRLSPFQRSPVFRAIYWKLGDQGPISRALSELGKLDSKNTSDVPAILRNLQVAGSVGGPTDVDSSVLSNIAGQFGPGGIHGLDASTARDLLVRATVDSILSSPIAQGISEAERASLRDVGYRLNEESIRHFGGCEAIEDIKIKPGKIIVTVKEPLYRRLNELKDSAGIGIGEYQIERARQAISSLTINGKRPVVEIVEHNTDRA
jgi:hypothetical protein